MSKQEKLAKLLDTFNVTKDWDCNSEGDEWTIIELNEEFSPTAIEMLEEMINEFSDSWGCCGNVYELYDIYPHSK